ncbi:MAG: heme exporter protein CcmB [Dehalococcoidia bacterium]|nr:heme exporter protein CcmB [Dehalococcoidia bacterium]
MKFWTHVAAIAWKDILSELRTREIITSVLVFAVLILVIFNFTFNADSSLMRQIAPGILWVAFVFSGVLALNRAFIPEKEEGCLDGLMCCPVEREAIYVGKALGSLFFMLLVEVVVLSVFALLFNIAAFQPEIIVVTLLATIGFVAVGTLFSAMAINTRAREMVLPILFLPIITPVIIAAVSAVTLVLDAKSWGDIFSWLVMLIAFDVIFTVVSFMVFPYIIEE